MKPDARIMVEWLVARYPNNVGFHDFVRSLYDLRMHDVLCQIYSDIMRGGELIETREQWSNAGKI